MLPPYTLLCERTPMRYKSTELSMKQIKASEIKGVVITSIVLCIIFAIVAVYMLQGDI